MRSCGAPHSRRLQLSGLSVTPAAYAPVAPDRLPLLKRDSLSYTGVTLTMGAPNDTSCTDERGASH